MSDDKVFLSVVRINIGMNEREILINCSRNKEVYEALTEHGRQRIDTMVNAMADAGLAALEAEGGVTETLVNEREPSVDEDFFSKHTVVEDN